MLVAELAVGTALVVDKGVLDIELYVLGEHIVGADLVIGLCSVPVGRLAVGIPTGLDMQLVLMTGAMPST